MADHFSSYSVTPDDPMTDVEIVTPDDATDLSVVSRGLLVNAGSISATHPVKVTLLGGSTVVLHLTSGVIHRLRVKRIHATDTDPQLLINPGSILSFW